MLILTQILVYLRIQTGCCKTDQQTYVSVRYNQCDIVLLMGMPVLLQTTKVLSFHRDSSDELLDSVLSRPELLQGQANSPMWDRCALGG